MAQTSISASESLESQVGKTSSNTFSFKQLNWDRSQTLNGYKPNYTFFLPISKRAKPLTAKLHLKLAFSPLLTQGTRVNLKFNQTLIRRLEHVPDSNHEQSWDIKLPLTQLSQNWQALNFSAFLVSTKSLCDLAIWIYISPESNLT
ncbi:MAG: cellulose biosynthesis cyclic di-GMP-binding regulatory protein BcsB [Tatlockia sp.]|nr:cellulose biosynthesis cyclic di-GMP-binding regulatory protein BcsB [Tatlockia sp.]